MPIAYRVLAQKGGESGSSRPRVYRAVLVPGSLCPKQDCNFVEFISGRGGLNVTGCIRLIVS